MSHALLVGEAELTEEEWPLLLESLGVEDPISGMDSEALRRLMGEDIDFIFDMVKDLLLDADLDRIQEDDELTH